MTPEMFDIYDEDANRIGTASREEVHTAGYWHQTFHCWLVRPEGNRRMVLFQLRSPSKDTFPDRFDITAAGHLTAGETIQEASRELQEELGLRVPFDRLSLLFTVRTDERGTVRGRTFIDREISHVFGYESDWPLDAYTLQEEEVSGLYEAELRELADLFEGTIDSLEVRGVLAPSTSADGNDGLSQAGSDAESVRTVAKQDFVPHPDDYYLRVFELLGKI
ncbi:NUDIX domain-containing protein [Paenibacillus chitinolyticus]|uniref:NUDIX domain-containing protein n=1 Tax=Paenibacillus chitinolyticus TaxID=79263 RepID=A0A410WRS2_9BACL|nr:NUDIX domain-containing protein [Paenibacillus chitinolyticus]MCY9593897.1 NUDIX domain-containing protein [Paenibacillus chitinolyticus]MCY9598787.1 NUDIX domain-containing protein [Paenibacillus chitinolyticus]QAV16997.1 NUDIX domain-containing protein [Paenibacillus chitinolyticus]